MNDAIVINGTVYRTGCNPVDDENKLKAIPNLKDVGLPKVSLDDAIEYCKSKLFFARNVFGPTWIGNQGQAGSCNGYAGAKALQRARVRRRLDFIKLSGEGLYGQINGNRDDGSQLVDGMVAIAETGVPTEELIPPRTAIYTSKFPDSWKEVASHYKAEEPYALMDEWDLVSALVLGFDVVVAVHVGNNWTTMDSNHIIPYSPGPGNHAVGVDDIRYRGTRFEFEHYGSWGTSVHDNGRAFLTWEGHLQSTRKNHGFYAIRSTIDDKQEQPLKL